MVGFSYRLDTVWSACFWKCTWSRFNSPLWKAFFGLPKLYMSMTLTESTHANVATARFDTTKCTMPNVAQDLKHWTKGKRSQRNPPAGAKPGAESETSSPRASLARGLPSTRQRTARNKKAEKTPRRKKQPQNKKADKKANRTPKEEATNTRTVTIRQSKRSRLHKSTNQAVATLRQNLLLLGVNQRTQSGWCWVVVAKGVDL